MIRTNELTVDRSLLIKNFETYKLSLEKFPVSRHSIAGGVRIKQPNDSQYSFLHHKEFGFHNHLYCDMWNENDVYLITSSGKVKRALINYQTEKIFGLTDVWEIPKHDNTYNCNFNDAISFPSSDLAVISDGNGYLYIVSTSNRKDPVQWKLLYHEEVLGEGKEFKVTCSQLEDDKLESGRKLHCLLHLIDTSTKGSTSRTKSSGYETVLYWLVFQEGTDSKWRKTVILNLRGQGSIDYLALEIGCQGLYVISDTEFYCPKLIDKTQESTSEQNGTPSEVDYYWQQTSEDVKVWFNIPSSTEKSDLKILAKHNSIEVAVKDITLLSGTLTQRIHADLTLWTYHNSKLEIVIQKAEPGKVWICLIKDDTKLSKEIVNEEFVAEIHEKLAHLCAENEETGGTAAMLNSGEMEECDAFGETRFLSRFQITTGEITHKAILGSEQWLFPVPISTDQLPAFCIRRDVDGIVWQPTPPQLDSDLFQCSHIHTFPAFGYIAASKQDKKFLLTPPNMNYVSIVNARGHVLVFRKTSLSSGSELRNRKTSTSTNSLFVQNLVNLETNCQVFGSVAWNQYLFVLTSEELIVINIK